MNKRRRQTKIKKIYIKEEIHSQEKKFGKNMAP
jgi:hypothetical protein